MTLLNAYVGETVFHLRGARAVISISHYKRDLKAVLNRTLEKDPGVRPEMFQLFRYAWFRDNQCWERIQKLIYSHTGKHLSVP